jgi:3-phenylpropionate/trans-cinnamate dioxygenase ferredoxin reductase component
MSSAQKVVIVGAGQAACEAAFQLRHRGSAGEISIVGEEKLPPYQRPPLSKKFLAGEWDESRLLLKPAEVYEAQNIALMLGRRATWIDRKTKHVRLDGGGEIAYDALILATGSRPRTLPLPGADQANVFVLRTVADVEGMKPFFTAGAKLVVIGAGYIGLEAAAVGRQLGLDVTVIEAMPRPLARVTSDLVAGFFLDQHTSRGVIFRLGAKAKAITGKGRASGVEIDGGEIIPADLVLIGAGGVPETSLAQKAELTIADGIVTDKLCRTSDPDIYAIGDCACRPLGHYGRVFRLESVHNAIEGGKIAAAAITGQTPPDEELPWFWSDQYELKWTIAGLFQGSDNVHVRGEPQKGAFAAFYYQEDKLLAVDAVNRPGDYLGAKQVMQRGRTIAPALVHDMSKTMKEIVAASV